MGVFCQNLGITENYSNFKSNFSFNNGSILEIHDYFRTEGDASFNNLSQIINALSNQDFAGLDNFRLRKILGKMKEMHAQLLKKNKNIRNESSMSDFLSSPFAPAMAMENASLAAGENTSLKLDKKRESLLESKLLKPSSGKISVLQETVSLLNTCLGEENQGQLKTDKELKILGKDLKKQMKENKSLSLKLCRKKRQIKKTEYHKHK